MVLKCITVYFRRELLTDDCGIVEYNVQIQLRFCLSETTCAQDDKFPSNITVRVNHQEVQLPVCDISVVTET